MQHGFPYTFPQITPMLNLRLLMSMGIVGLQQAFQPIANSPASVLYPRLLIRFAVGGFSCHDLVLPNRPFHFTYQDGKMPPRPLYPYPLAFLRRNGSVDQGCVAAWVEHKGGPALNIPEGGRPHSKAWFLAYHSLVLSHLVGCG
jgi:hypothetical protein